MSDGAPDAHKEREDPSGLREVVVEFASDLTYELALKVVHFVIAQLVRMREHRPFLRLAWGSRYVSVLELRGMNGPIALRQLLATRIANEFQDGVRAVVVRDEWSAPTQAQLSLMRVSYLRMDYAEEGPQALYTRHQNEAVTLLMQASEGTPVWPADDKLLADLASSLQGKPEQFRIETWVAKELE